MSDEIKYDPNPFLEIDRELDRLDNQYPRIQLPYTEAQGQELLAKLIPLEERLYRIWTEQAGLLTRPGQMQLRTRAQCFLAEIARMRLDASCPYTQATPSNISVEPAFPT
jgi:hypothetical protein